MSDDKPGLTEDMVRKLLAMNPQLRGDGKTTKDVLADVKGRTAPPPIAAPASASAARPDLDKTLSELERDHKEHGAEADKRDDTLARQLASVGDQANAITAQARELVMRVFLAKDPDLTSAESARILAKEKAFLDRVGFSLEGLLAEKRKKR
jgi:hypothetical protein